MDTRFCFGINANRLTVSFSDAANDNVAGTTRTVDLAGITLGSKFNIILSLTILL